MVTTAVTLVALAQTSGVSSESRRQTRASGRWSASLRTIQPGDAPHIRPRNLAPAANRMGKVVRRLTRHQLIVVVVVVAVVLLVVVVTTPDRHRSTSSQTISTPQQEHYPHG
jgi:hypothetical protein